jgi:predicted phage tail protein
MKNLLRKRSESSSRKKRLQYLRCLSDEYGRASQSSLSSQIDVVTAQDFLKAIQHPEMHQVRQRIAVLEKTVERQGAAIAQIQAMLADPPSAPRDEYAVWVESNDADQYAGMYVAFVPGEGAIGAATTIKELRLKIQDHPLSKKAAIVTVPDEVG